MLARAVLPLLDVDRSRCVVSILKRSDVTASDAMNLDALPDVDLLPREVVPVDRAFRRSADLLNEGEPGKRLPLDHQFLDVELLFSKLVPEDGLALPPMEVDEVCEQPARPLLVGHVGVR
jgi:hypothetical protein